MKGIILAGGRGSRLWPLTKTISKQLLPVYDKPMIYYPITTLILSGIKEILIVTSPTQIELFQQLLEDGKQWGIEIKYAVQEKPRGIADALLVGEDFLKNDDCMLVLGDNFIYGAGLGRSLVQGFTGYGATICAYYVDDPSDYGVVTFNSSNMATQIVEKPSQFISNWAIPGIYFYDKTAVSRAKELKPSNRGELEITDLNRLYLDDSQLKVTQLPRGTAWLDLGNSANLLEASNFVHILQDRQGLLIGSPEEASLAMGNISNSDLYKLKNESSNYAINIFKLS